MFRVLALDQASVAGYCVLIEGEIKESGKWTSQGIDYPHKIRWLEVKMEELIDKYDIEVVVVETPMRGVNMTTFHKLSGLYFTTIDLALRKELSYFAYGPSSWRKILGFKQGRGVKRAELKQQAIDYVNENTELNLKNSQDDEAEAVCIGMAYHKQTTKEK